eukprot:TRINITY_DN2617_c0_g1_i1.p1 TRINITY_DN2617_c0_g1~~TRINITY_DN2617_c0_g1_i1.p1  ORF type:complete len:488 (+),score=173.23 TRINITY_DN2617_c0_g1_i1:35-1465(+)
MYSSTYVDESLFSRPTQITVKNPNISVISASELNSLSNTIKKEKSIIGPSKSQIYLKNKAEELHEKSMKRTKKWTNTIKSERENILKVQKKAAEEEELYQQHLEQQEAALRREQSLKQQQMIYEKMLMDDERIKELDMRANQTDINHELQKQIEWKNDLNKMQKEADAVSEVYTPFWINAAERDEQTMKDTKQLDINIKKELEKIVEDRHKQRNVTDDSIDTFTLFDKMFERDDSHQVMVKEKQKEFIKANDKLISTRRQLEEEKNDLEDKMVKTFDEQKAVFKACLTDMSLEEKSFKEEQANENFDRLKKIYDSNPKSYSLGIEEESFVDKSEKQAQMLEEKRQQRQREIERHRIEIFNRKTKLDEKQLNQKKRHGEQINKLQEELENEEIARQKAVYAQNQKEASYNLRKMQQKRNLAQKDLIQEKRMLYNANKAAKIEEEDIILYGQKLINERKEKGYDTRDLERHLAVISNK